MNLGDLVRRWRVLAKDAVKPYLCSDDDVTDWLNDAENEACIRGRLIREDQLAEVCQIALTPGTAAYALHPSVYEIHGLRLVPVAGRTRPLSLVTREWLDAEINDWRTTTRPAEWVIQDDTRLVIVGLIEASDVLQLDTYRLPLTPMEDEYDTPEIHQTHHVHLIQWALHRAFSIPDNELFDAKRADLAEQEFTAYFGLRPDSDLRRSTRQDVPHYNVSPLV